MQLFLIFVLYNSPGKIGSRKKGKNQRKQNFWLWIAFISIINMLKILPPPTCTKVPNIGLTDVKTSFSFLVLQSSILEKNVQHSSLLLVKFVITFVFEHFTYKAWFTSEWCFHPLLLLYFQSNEAIFLITFPLSRFVGSIKSKTYFDQIRHYNYWRINLWLN